MCPEWYHNPGTISYLVENLRRLEQPHNTTPQELACCRDLSGQLITCIGTLIYAGTWPDVRGEFERLNWPAQESMNWSDP